MLKTLGADEEVVDVVTMLVDDGTVVADEGVYSKLVSRWRSPDQ